AHPGLHRHRDLAGTPDRGPDDLLVEASAPGECGATAVAGDLSHRAAEVEVDVLSSQVVDHATGCELHHVRFGSVELDGTGRLVRAEAGELLGLGMALDQPAGRDHLADVQAGPPAAAELAERCVGDTGHR